MITIQHLTKLSVSMKIDPIDIITTGKDWVKHPELFDHVYMTHSIDPNRLDETIPEHKQIMDEQEKICQHIIDKTGGFLILFYSEENGKNLLISSKKLNQSNLLFLSSNDLINDSKIIRTFGIS